MSPIWQLEASDAGIILIGKDDEPFSPWDCIAELLMLAFAAFHATFFGGGVLFLCQYPLEAVWMGDFQAESLLWRVALSNIFTAVGLTLLFLMYRQILRDILANFGRDCLSLETATGQLVLQSRWPLWHNRRRSFDFSKVDHVTARIKNDDESTTRRLVLILPSGKTELQLSFLKDDSSLVDLALRLNKLLHR